MNKNISKLIPLSGYVLIEPIDEEQTTVSGLVMPDKEKEKPAKGKVIAIGKPDFEMMKLAYEQKIDPYLLTEYKVSDTVVFHRWSGQDVKEGQKEYRLVKFSDLMGVYE